MAVPYALYNQRSTNSVGPARPRCEPLTKDGPNRSQKMRIIVVIPCFNEEDGLKLVLEGVPIHIQGATSIQTLVVDDGSTDQTAEVAKLNGVDYLLRLPTNRGLGAAFEEGLKTACALGADIIVNIDGDNQYPAEQIERLVQPIMGSNAAFVVGCRDLTVSDTYSPIKRLLHRTLTLWLSKLIGIDIEDPVSGFKAMTADVAKNLIGINRFSHTLDNLVWCNYSGVPIETMIVKPNPKVRDSRLAKSNFHFLRRQMASLISALCFWRPVFLFNVMAAVCLLIVVLPNLFRVIYYLNYVQEAAVQFKMGSGLAVVLGSILTALFFLAAFIFSLLGKYRTNLTQQNRILQGLSVSSGDYWRQITLFQRTTRAHDDHPVYTRVSLQSGVDRPRSNP